MTIYDIYTKQEIGKLLIEASIFLKKNYNRETTIRKLFTDYTKMIGSTDIEAIPTSFLFQTVMNKQMINKIRAYNTCFDLALLQIGG